MGIGLHYNLVNEKIRKASWVQLFLGVKSHTELWWGQLWYFWLGSVLLYAKAKDWEGMGKDTYHGKGRNMEMQESSGFWVCLWISRHILFNEIWQL